MNRPITQLELVPAVAIDVKPDPKSAAETLIAERLEQAEFERRLWDADSPELCIADQPPIATYVNIYGAAVIRQRSVCGDDDPVVTVLPENLPALIAALKRYLP